MKLIIHIDHSCDTVDGLMVCAHVIDKYGGCCHVPRDVISGNFKVTTSNEGVFIYQMIATKCEVLCDK